MRQGSYLDVCALLGTMREEGGLLSKKPPKKQTAVRGVPDAQINVPAIQLSFVTQRLVCLWRERALKAEAQLAEMAGPSGEEAE